MNRENINDTHGLKGRYNLALGNEMGIEIVCGQMPVEVQTNIRTKMNLSCFRANNWFNSVRTTVNVSANVFARTRLFVAPTPGALPRAMICRAFSPCIGLKGLWNLAQGKRSVAMGCRTDKGIVRAITFIKEKILFRTKRDERQFPVCAGRRPKGVFRPDYWLFADGFSPASRPPGVTWGQDNLGFQPGY